MNEVNHRMQGIADLAYLLYDFGILNVVICPGSRNAPVINSLVSFKKLNCISIVDERSAAYFAMGIAQKLNQPVAITCTSGTAALNMAPAIAESYYSGIPLIAITADRPPEWIDQSDGQAINQKGIFANFIKYETDLPVQTANESDLWFFRREVSYALNKCVENKYGPVHINIPVHEPLYDEMPVADINVKTIKTLKSSYSVIDNFSEFIKKWNLHKRKLIVIGISQGDETLNSILAHFANFKDTVVIAENLANVSDANFIHSPETFIASLRDDEMQKYAPDLLITIGEGVVSKRLKQFLRKYKPKEHWSINSFGSIYPDTFQSLSHIVLTDPASLLAELSVGITSTESDYASIFYENEIKIKSELDIFQYTSSFCDMKVIGMILEMIPSNTDVVLANSTPVRLAQLFPTRKDLRYYSNRGTSGIDGCLSTASGIAYVSDKHTYLIVSDLAFIYDSNALWNDYLPDNLKILLLNNGGGNIFQMIKTGVAYNLINTFLETPHKVNMQLLCQAFNIEHFFADNIEDFKKEMNHLIDIKKIAVLEIRTNMNTNTEMFKTFFKELKK